MDKRIHILGIPMDLGQSRRGVDMGPSAVRYAGLSERLSILGFDVKDDGNIQVAVRDSMKELVDVNYMPALVKVLEQVYLWGEATVKSGALPLFIGGDHSVALGTISGVSSGRRTGVIWVDAHGDFNTHETSPSGNIHGMPLAALCGLGHPDLVNLGRPGQKVNPRDVVLLGIRDLDAGEKVLLRESGATVYTMREIDEAGIAEIMRRVLKDMEHLQHIHLSLDMDSLDPAHAPGVGTPVSGGLTSREAHLIMEMLADFGRITSADLVEVNPILDDRNKTAELAVDLATSLFGKSII